MEIDFQGDGRIIQNMEKEDTLGDVVMNQKEIG
jgi:hypothetical protein